MKYPIRVANGWGPLFSLFGFSRKTSFIEVTDTSLIFHFGTANEEIPMSEVLEVAPRRWPLYYGLGAKIAPDGGVAYVGSTKGVIQIKLRSPRQLNVWGPFKKKQAEAITVSLEDPDGFSKAIKDALNSPA